MLKSKFEIMPLGEVTPKGYLKSQFELQANNITGNMELYEEFSAKSGWLGGTGESWERGTYYTRGLVALAYASKDKNLIKKAYKWIDYALNSQQPNGNFGPELKPDDNSNVKELKKRKKSARYDWWPKMPMLMAIRDYYVAEKALGNKDERVLEFFDKYFKFQKRKLTLHRIGFSWAFYRAADNMEVIVWYKNELEANGNQNTEWLDKLANKILKQSYDWEQKMKNGNSLRHHVVNTTQGYKHPFIKYLITGDETCLTSIYTGLESIRKDHGRIDNMPNADEPARDNLPTRGTETCAVVEGLLSLEMGGAISGDSKIYDIVEGYAYNNLPNCFDYDITGYCYYQLQNQVLASHGYHDFRNDHGDSCAIGISGFECCFSNLHMGYPKFVQNMWVKEGDKLVLAMYGENRVNTKINGKNIIFDQLTKYPFEDKTKLTYKGEDTSLTIKFRVPEWTKKFVINDKEYEAKAGFVEEKFDLVKGDIISIQFKSEIEVNEWHHNSKYVKKGAVLYCMPIEEDWKVIEDFRYRGIKYMPKENTKNYEIFPKENWAYTFKDDAKFTFKNNMKYKKTGKTSPDNMPNFIKVNMNKVSNWDLHGNVADTIENACLEEEVVEKKLVPYGFSRLKISVFPKEGDKECKQDDELLKIINDSIGNAEEFETKEIVGDGFVQLDYPLTNRVKNYFVKGSESNKYEYISKPIKFNGYKFSFDPYGKKIELDKGAVSIDNTQDNYVRIAIVRNNAVVKISKEIKVEKTK